jgi:long-chain acyl-CoA synthetase
VKAYVVPRSPNLTQDSLRAHCKEMLTAYKVPRFVEFRKELPKTPIGKILRKDLRAEFLASQQKNS